MSVCSVKELVERYRQQAINARKYATDEQCASLDQLIYECDQALKHVTWAKKRTQARLNMWRADVVITCALRIHKEHPGLLGA